MSDICRKCRFWLVDERVQDPNDLDFGWGACRRDPPVFVGALAALMVPRPAWGQEPEDEMLSTVDLSRASQHPVTFAKDWCGRFEAQAS